MIAAPGAAAGAHLKLRRIDFPAALALAPGPPAFAAPPAPWIVEHALPEPEAPAEGMPVEMASRFDHAAEVPLLEQARKGEKGIAESLEKVGAPLAGIRVVEQEERRDDGKAAYFLVSSLALLSGSALLGYLTRRKPPYSLSDEPLAAGGRPAPPLLVLPVAQVQDS